MEAAKLIKNKIRLLVRKFNYWAKRLFFLRLARSFLSNF